MSNRPPFSSFLYLWAVLFVCWLIYLGWVIWDIGLDRFNLPFTLEGMLFGVVSAGVLSLALYSVAWGAKAVSQMLKPGPEVRGVGAWLVDGQVERQHEVLEIKAAGLGVHDVQQSNIWRLIKQTSDNFVSVLAPDAHPYPDSVQGRRKIAANNVRVAYRNSAGDAVGLWPVPTFALGPPKQPEHIGAAANITAGRNAAYLGVTLFVWQEAQNTTHAQGMLEKLFQFFDENPDVPQALLVSEDGDFVRNGYRPAGTPAMEDGHALPKVFESMTGLLLSRSDRVDKYLRASAPDHGQNDANRKVESDRFVEFFWQRYFDYNATYSGQYNPDQPETPRSPALMSSGWWHAQLPVFWRTFANYGPGLYKPSPWLPVRWDKLQLDEFDSAPLLGYLHRPVKRSMTDENGQRLKLALQIQTMQELWLDALATLPKSAAPVRVFYDSTDNLELGVALANALHVLNTDGSGIETTNPQEGFDLGRRLGDTGVSSALVAINVATMASYLDGGISAVVYMGSDESVTVQMVRPPDDLRRAENALTRGPDPFVFRIYGTAP